MFFISEDETVFQNTSNQVILEFSSKSFPEENCLQDRPSRTFLAAKASNSLVGFLLGSETFWLLLLVEFSIMIHYITQKRQMEPVSSQESE